MNLNLKNKLSGALFGCAVGDALGLAGEFMNSHEIAFRYPDGISSFDQIYRDSHRCQWEPGEWSNDTEVNLRMLNTRMDVGAFDIIALARAFKEWYNEQPLDMPSQYRFIFNNPEYLTDPEKVSGFVDESMNSNIASNECVVRAAFVGIFPENPLEEAARVCRLTHADTRCVCACVVIAKMAHAILWENRTPQPDEILELAAEIDERVLPYIEMAAQPTLEALDLDDDDTYWIARKAMASGLWAVWHCDSPMQGFDAIFREGGDVDTNAAVAIALLGLRDGFSALPADLIETMPHRQRLYDTAERLNEYFHQHFLN